jgi:predicted flavoprotein YhiN
VPLEKGECVAGGIALDEVDPQTLESRKVGGLFICGEVLDIAGPVGGYNLQAAFATGYVAGESATR